MEDGAEALLDVEEACWWGDNPLVKVGQVTGVGAGPPRVLTKDGEGAPEGSEIVFIGWIDNPLVNVEQVTEVGAELPKVLTEDGAEAPEASEAVFIWWVQNHLVNMRRLTKVGVELPKVLTEAGAGAPAGSGKTVLTGYGAQTPIKCGARLPTAGEEMPTVYETESPVGCETEVLGGMGTKTLLDGQQNLVMSRQRCPQRRTEEALLDLRMC